MIGTRILASAGILVGVAALAIGSCRSEPKEADAAVSEANKAASPVSLTVPPTRIGINVSGLAWYGQQRSFANLMAVSSWRDGWKDVSPPQVDANGTLRSLAPGQFAPAMLGLPAGPFKSVSVRCTYKGNGSIRSDGFVKLARAGKGYSDFDFVWQPNKGIGWVQIERTDPADPIRDFDCREPWMPADAVYAPAFLASLKGFGVIRFLDWQETNGNQGGKWSKFVPQGGQFRRNRAEGVRVEDMVLLANQTHSDPWFLMPYNADAEYLNNFAQYVHDHLDPGLTVYVELSNEVWNYMFPATQQALREGNAAGLSSDQHEALLRRYAQKATEALKVWTAVFTDNPKRLVRVVSTQNAFTESSGVVLGFKDTAKYVDALATAPYIQYSLKGRTTADLDRIFAELPAAIDSTFDLALRNKQTAARYGKRYIAYEGGQHLTTEDQTLAVAVQRDPRMGKIYSLYLQQWQKRLGDLMVLYAHTGPISKYGSWGLREYADQPPSEAPKWQAVQQFINGDR